MTSNSNNFHRGKEKNFNNKKLKAAIGISKETDANVTTLANFWFISSDRLYPEK